MLDPVHTSSPDNGQKPTVCKYIFVTTTN